MFTSRPSRRTVACSAVAMAVLAATLSIAAADATKPDILKGYDAHTEPNQVSKVNFAVPGIVDKLLVKEGDAVRKGDPLIQQDDRADKLALEALRLEGNSSLKIDAAQADLDQKRVEFERKKKNLIDGSANESEIREAEVGVRIREIQVDVEKLTRKQKALEADRQGVRVEQMTCVAPFDGIVERIDLKPGETPEQQRFAVTVVNNSPLWVSVYLPTKVAINMKLGEELTVKYKDVDDVVKGKIIKLAPRADAASETREVRLEVPNPKNLPSGLSVLVMAPEPSAPSKTASR